MKHILTAAAIISAAILAVTTTTAYAEEVEGIANKTIKIDKNPGIKVLLMNSTTTITLTPQTTRIVYDKNDKQLDKFPLGSPITLTLKNGKFTKDDGKTFDADMLKLVAADPEGKTTDNPDGIISFNVRSGASRAQAGLCVCCARRLWLQQPVQPGWNCVLREQSGLCAKGTAERDGVHSCERFP